MGVMGADTFASATAAAALGGTTTVIPFAAQHQGKSLAEVVQAYHALATRGAVIDYAMHMIIADPTEKVLTEELPALIRAGHGSIKVFMTYEKTKIDDEQLLDVLHAARAHKALVCVHAENNGMINWLGRRLVSKGYTAPRYHAVYHPRLSEAEAFHRLIACAELLDQPIMIYHVSTAEGAAVIREARGRGLKVFGETCTQYLLLTRNDLDKPGLEGAKWVCSPPLRTRDDQEALWRALDLGDLQLISSDHAPYTMDEKGKFWRGPNPPFSQIANGMPGLELRLPLLFDAIVSNGRFGVEQFVAWTSTEPARIYGLDARKGSLAIGADADICVWDPERRSVITDAGVHDGSKFTPYAGRTIKGWPEVVLRRGAVIVENGVLHAQPGSGRFLPRDAGRPAEPTGRLSDAFDPARNFGAELY
jgi:dihydropyrimidinase